MPAPKKVQEVFKGWYKQCMQRLSDIPTIPEIAGHFQTEWALQAQPSIDVKWIRFDLVRFDGVTAQLVINRKGPVF
jgi:hypothetical protein